MTRLKQCVAVLVLGALSVAMLSGFSDYEIAELSAENNTAIEDAIVGANNVILTVGTFQSETGLTCSLTEDEIEAQVDAFNNRVDDYFTPEYPAYTQYMELNDYLLNDIFSNTVDYQVTGGVDSSKLTAVTYGADGLSALAEGYLQVHTTSVIGEDDDLYSVNCSSNIVAFTAELEKLDGIWKVRTLDLNFVEDWVAEDSLDSLVADDYQISVANDVIDEYSSFMDAYTVASEISIQKSCSITLEDVVDMDSEPEVKKTNSSVFSQY
jgi:hypothetical protein